MNLENRLELLEKDNQSLRRSIDSHRRWCRILAGLAILPMLAVMLLGAQTRVTEKIETQELVFKGSNGKVVWRIYPVELKGNETRLVIADAEETEVADIRSTFGEGETTFNIFQGKRGKYERHDTEVTLGLFRGPRATTFPKFALRAHGEEGIKMETGVGSGGPEVVVQAHDKASLRMGVHGGHSYPIFTITDTAGKVLFEQKQPY